MTHTDYRARERQRALDHAPAQELTESQFRAELAAFPLAGLRLAAVRWSAPRGRTHEQVINGIVAALHNPHLNQGDSFRLALGHVRCCSADGVRSDAGQAKHGLLRAGTHEPRRLP